MRHAMRKRRASHRAYLSILTSMLLAALLSGSAACGEPYCPSTISLPRLTLPNVRFLTSINRYSGNESADTALATYVSAGSQGQPAGAHLVYDGADVTIASGEQRSFSISPYCSETAVTSDGQWIACVSQQGVEFAPLSDIRSPYEVTSILAQLVLPLAHMNGSLSLAWSPDNHHLAVLQSGLLTLYVVTPSYAHAYLTARLDLGPAVGCSASSQMPCPLRYLAWSPDGAWLAFIDSLGPATTSTLLALHLGVLVPGNYGSDKSTLDISVRDSALVTVGATRSNVHPAWVPESNLLTYVSADGSSLLESAVPGGAPAIILSQKEVQLGGLAWTPDRRYLAFTGEFYHVPEPIPTSTLPLATGTPHLSSAYIQSNAYQELADMNPHHRPLILPQPSKPPQSAIPLACFESDLSPIDFYVYTPPTT